MQTFEELYRELSRKTLCPYSYTAKVYFATMWDSTESFESNFSFFTKSFDYYIKNSIYDYDICVLTVRGSVTSDINTWACFVKQLLFSLAKYDGQYSPFDGIDSINWDYKYSGYKFFIPTFGPFYPQNHSRYSHNDNVAFILFQPDLTFSRFKISSSAPQREQLTYAIRKKFLDAGIDYDLYLVKGSPKALRYVKPLKRGDSYIRWWEVKC